MTVELTWNLQSRLLHVLQLLNCVNICVSYFVTVNNLSLYTCYNRCIIRIKWILNSLKLCSVLVIHEYSNYEVIEIVK